MEDQINQRIDQLSARYDRAAIIVMLVAIFIGAIGIVLYTVGQVLDPVNMPMIITGYTLLGIVVVVMGYFTIDLGIYYIRRLCSNDTNGPE